VTISSLKSLLTTEFIQKAASPRAGAKDNKLQELISGKGSEGFSTTLRTGARNFSLGLQALNRGISYLQVSRSAQSNLSQLAQELEGVVDRGAKGGETAQTLLTAFDSIARKFDLQTKTARKDKDDLLDVEDLAKKLEQAGLDPESTEGFSTIFGKITTIGAKELPSSEELRSAMQRARAAVEQAEERGDTAERRSFFSTLKREVGALASSLKENVKGLDESLSYVQKNIELVRETGFAFLNTSERITSADKADSVLLKIRQELKDAAKRGSLQLQNLESILDAGQDLLSESQKK
jgi:NADH dehydrogenase/NADH:ubiquinone oxidoreductase subunit G